VRPCRWRWLFGAVTAVLIAIMVGLGAVSLLVFTVFVGLLSVLVDIAPAQVSLPVMQLSRPTVCLGGPVMRTGGPVMRLARLTFGPLHVSVGPLLELGRAAHLLGRGTVHRLYAVVDRLVVVMQLPRPGRRFVIWLGGLAGTVTGFARTLEAPPFAGLVLVASARWSSHTGQHRSTSGRSATAGAARSDGDLEKR
jgi:hypothetical protein